MPSHHHDMKIKNSGGAYTFNYAVEYSNSETKGWRDGSLVGDSGSGRAHNNLQPYITCYMYKRVA